MDDEDQFFDVTETEAGPEDQCYPMPMVTSLTDHEIRTAAIHWSMQVSHTDNIDLMQRARQFYMFITQQDPVIDRPNPEGTNVVHINF